VTRSRFALIVLAVLLLSLLGTAVILASLPRPVPVGSALDAGTALSADEQRFYRSTAPILRAAAGEARALTIQGQERSRNLFAIRAGQGRLHEHLATLDAQLTEAQVPGRFSSAAELYRAGAADVRASMRRAEAAFLRFDWDEVGAATELMAEGTAQLEAAVAAFQCAAATPVAS
jgi:hypothetical protein